MALAVGAGGGCLDVLLSSIFSLLFLPLSGRRPRYRLKYCLEGPLNPKQPTTNLPQIIIVNYMTRYESVISDYESVISRC